ncbi:hypothetical protein NDU88_005262 [Pleurodeles waltl]|uniref:Uncharacterized protein n=1 Tax=Pleurodeles waltl TaxID=8319 RepID=A0AAV7MIW3_PLEWA|nr:hypothetical protein NDU88_005262 [Pleurodeles waltl]
MMEHCTPKGSGPAVPCSGVAELRALRMPGGTEGKEDCCEGGPLRTPCSGAGELRVLRVPGGKEGRCEGGQQRTALATELRAAPD